VTFPIPVCRRPAGAPAAGSQIRSARTQNVVFTMLSAAYNTAGWHCSTGVMSSPYRYPAWPEISVHPRHVRPAAYITGFRHVPPEDAAPAAGGAAAWCHSMLLKCALPPPFKRGQAARPADSQAGCRPVMGSSSSPLQGAPAQTQRRRPPRRRGSSCTLSSRL
jgi:hypothetical protein